MEIKIRGASEHNLKAVDADFTDGLTVVTGVSGSGKTSLVFDTLYHEARRRFLEIFSSGPRSGRLGPADVQSITGVGPAVALGQNLLNRNPLSILATASGLHPFLRLLYARFGTRHCPLCNAPVSVSSEDETVEQLHSLSKQGPLTISASLVHRAKGSHRTLIELLFERFGRKNIIVDGKTWKGYALDPCMPHDVQLDTARVNKDTPASHIRKAVQTAYALGSIGITARSKRRQASFSRTPVCSECGQWLGEIEPAHFHTSCQACRGKGCAKCAFTGLHPRAAAVRRQGYTLPELLRLSVDEARSLLLQKDLPHSARRLMSEIRKRLDSLAAVGLGYLQLDRPSPTLSRGESQRTRLAVCLTNRLEDILYVLDEPTIGQHPADLVRLLPAFRKLLGSVIYVEHDRMAAAFADQAIDIGPGAGAEGGQIVFAGEVAKLWKADTATGRYFSLRERSHQPRKQAKPSGFLTVKGAHKNNLRNIDVRVPTRCLTVVTGVSGAGKSTFVEEVLVPTLKQGRPVGCAEIEDATLMPVLVDQSPIGKNPRSNPATYTKLADIIRDLYAQNTGLSASHFSFNRTEGACLTCRGMGAVEVRMRYLPSTWIPCSDCGGQRFSDEVLGRQVEFGERRLSIADFYNLTVSQASYLLGQEHRLSVASHRAARRMLDALESIGLGYLRLGQPSPTLSGGEAQRIKLAKYLGRRSTTDRLFVLDEPTTGLHPKDLAGLIKVLYRLVQARSTLVVVEHNTDIIRAADWIIDLGPGAGPNGGHIIYEGPPEGLAEAKESKTGQALKQEGLIQPETRSQTETKRIRSDLISIRNARANNLKNVTVAFPKSQITIVTGVSGSGKSSLVRDVLESEARRRFLETLSMYERQGIHEGPEAPVESVSGLGVSVSITPPRRLYRRRSTVGTATEIQHHLAVLLAVAGERTCLKCGEKMHRGEIWICPACGDSAQIAQPRHFSPSTYSAACLECHGIGTFQAPAPSKLIRNLEKPLCNGAMHSPGFFPKGYLCKPYNGGYYIVQALAKRYGFNPTATPWNEMTEQAQEAFLYGDPQPLDVTFESRKRPPTTREIVFRGFYNHWLRDWDIGGTYTRTEPCKRCGGTGFRPEYTAVTLGGRNIHQLGEEPLWDLLDVLREVRLSALDNPHAKSSLQTALSRLRFLIQVGLGYLNLNRVAGTLSAGEAQRVKLAGLLGSNLTSLTILLDEPSRGMHPKEVTALLDALKELRDAGNTVIAVEHDPMIVQSADYLIDMGPGPGVQGGRIVASGTAAEVMKSATLTARWFRGEKRIHSRRNVGLSDFSYSIDESKRAIVRRRRAREWLIIEGARANNLQGEAIRVPLGLLVGVCGVSGSGKSTLLIDTVGLALAPKKITTSVAYEPVEPGKHDSIRNAPAEVALLDQTQKDIRSPSQFLGIAKPLLRIYSESTDAAALGLSKEELAKPCSTCGGSGLIRTRMMFLPDVFSHCETCRGTGSRQEAWEVHVKDVSLPEVNNLTIDEVYELFGDEETLSRKLKAARDVGLGYLVLNQPGHTLSGGESQRLRIAKELSKKTANETLYILDEPTVGQHMEDTARLVEVLQRLVDHGHSVIVIEHHPHLLSACDWLIELGPQGGPRGGRVIAQGTPEAVAEGDTPTAPYLKKVLEGKI